MPQQSDAYHSKSMVSSKMPRDDPFLLYKPILILTKVSGAQLPLENRQKYVVTTAIFFVFFLLATLKALEDVSTVHLLPEHIRNEQFDRFTLCANLVTVLHIFVFYYKNGKVIFGLLQKLYDFDDTLQEELNVAFHLPGSVFYLIACFLVIIAVCIARIVIFYVIHNSLQFHTITNTIVSYFQYNMTLHYVFFLLQLQFRFTAINEYLSVLRETNYILTKRRLRLIKILHEHLYGVARSIDGAFGVYQAHAIIFSCGEQVMDCFFLIFVLRECLKRGETIFRGDAIDILVDWFFKMTVQLFVVFSFAHKVEAESRKTEGLLLSLYVNSKTPHHLVPEIRSFCIYTEENKLSFSSAGLFPITWSELGVLWSDTTSYLLFLIQYQISAQSQNNENRMTIG